MRLQGFPVGRNVAPGMISDEALMLEFQGGSQPAFEQLFTRYRGPLYGFFRRRLNDDQRAQDLTQETFVAVIRASAKYQASLVPHVSLQHRDEPASGGTAQTIPRFARGRLPGNRPVTTHPRTRFGSGRPSKGSTSRSARF
jgi:hypothetical protein